MNNEPNGERLHLKTVTKYMCDLTYDKIFSVMVEELGKFSETQLIFSIEIVTFSLSKKFQENFPSTKNDSSICVCNTQQMTICQKR